MIEELNGHLSSVRTPEEVVTLLAGELDSLTESEVGGLFELLADLESNDDPEVPSLLEQSAAREWVRQPVSIEQFILDPYYLGATCEGFYPIVLEDLEELFSGGYHECIFTGAVSWGKTFTASVIICRILYELSCMVDPCRAYGLRPGSNMSLVCFSVTEELATKVVFENISSKIQASPYFRECFRFKPNKQELKFPRGLWVSARASTDTSALGLNVIATFLDEASFLPELSKAARERLGPHAKTRAEGIYQMLRRRMKSRFMRQGNVPGMFVIASSKRTNDDFIIKRIKSSKADPTVFVRDYALWDTKPEDYYATKRFQVLVGDEAIQSKLLTPEDAEILRADVAKNYLIIDVPEDFRQDFEDNLDEAIRDIAGVSTTAIAPYFTRRDKILAAVDADRSHPCAVDEWDPSTELEIYWEQLAMELPYGVEKRWRPLINPEAPRFIHIDPSKSKDPTGFCMGHIAGWHQVRRRMRNGAVVMETAPLILIDFLLRVIPPVGGEIELARLRELIYELSAHGYRIERVTMDQWNSVDTIQQLRAKGYTADVFSVDKPITAYRRTKVALYEDRVSYYEYGPLLHELRKVEHIPRLDKVDHVPGETKDVADAFVGVVANLEAFPPLETSSLVMSRAVESDGV